MSLKQTGRYAIKLSELINTFLSLKQGGFAVNRDFLKDSIRLKIDFSETDQNKGITAPVLQKPVPAKAKLLSLPEPCRPDICLVEAIENRRSVRNFEKEPISPEELSFLLWTTQGLRTRPYKGHAFRNVPSAGCRHSFETYLAVFNVTGLKKGIYRYLPCTHQLLFIDPTQGLERKISAATLGQAFAGDAAVTFIWATVPYRMEWRYGQASYKVIALDAGHVCQNLYLGCEAIGCGTCAIAAYDQNLMDDLLGIDGKDEFTIYVAPVGKVHN